MRGKPNLFFKLNNYSHKKGSAMIEVLIAVGLFAMVITIVSIVLFPLLSGSQHQSIMPQLNRLRMELLARQLDQDASIYPLIYAYEGEVRTTGGDRVTPISLKPIVKLCNIKDERDFLAQVPELDDVIYFGSPNNPADNPDPKKRVFTLLLIGKSGGLDVVYYIGIKDLDDGLEYEVVRLSASGMTHQVLFRTPSQDSSGGVYSLSNPDQDLPYFRKISGGEIESVGGLTQAQENYYKRRARGQLDVLLPNPFSRSILTEMLATPYQVYKNPLVLRYFLKEQRN